MILQTSYQKHILFSLHISHTRLFLCLYYSQQFHLLLCYLVTKSCLTLRDPLTSAYQTSLPFAINQNLLRLMSSSSFFFLLTLIMGICGGSAGRESTCNAGDPSSIPGSGRFPGEGKGYPLQYSGLQLSMDCIVISNSNFQ